MDAATIPFAAEFDAVFSNAALHWVRDQDAALAGTHRALKPGGRLVAEMGGEGNVAIPLAAIKASFFDIQASCAATVSIRRKCRRA